MQDLFFNANSSLFFQILDAIVFLLFSFTVLYLIFFSVASLFPRKLKYDKAAKQSKMAVLYQMRSDNMKIVDTIKSLFNQSYSRELYDVCVLTSEVSNNLKSELNALGVNVLVCPNVKTKLQAYKYFNEYLDNEESNAQCIVCLDSEDTLEEEYLDKINDAFYAGCYAIQTHRRNEKISSLFNALSSMSDEINNSIFRKGHCTLSLSSALRGSGMLFERNVFRFCLNTISNLGVEKQFEDVLLKKGFYIEYLESVYTYHKKSGEKYNYPSKYRSMIILSLLSGFRALYKFPLSLLNSNIDYADKQFQWILPSRFLLVFLIIILGAIATSIDWYFGIKWAVLLLLLVFAFIIAIPKYLINTKLFLAILLFPILVILMPFRKLL